MRIHRKPTDAGSPARKTTLLNSVNFLLPRHWRKAQPAEQQEKPRPIWRALRREKVQHAKQLIADVSYPSRDVLRSMADTLARNINFWRLLPFLHL